MELVDDVDVLLDDDVSDGQTRSGAGRGIPQKGGRGGCEGQGGGAGDRGCRHPGLNSESESAVINDLQLAGGDIG